MPEGVLTGDFPNWRGWSKAEGAGWCHARNALVAAASEAEKQGVKCMIEKFPFDKVEDAVKHMESGKVRFRSVIVME